MTAPLALATCRDFPSLSEDEGHLVAALEAAGIPAEPVVWNDDVDWGERPAVLLRTVWDYWLEPEAFLAWLASLEHAGVPCWNAPSLVRWNLDKRYLRDLAAKGVPTVPTLWLEPGEVPSPEVAVERIRATGWPEVVLKPAVSAGAWKTLRLARQEVAAHASHVADVLSRSTLMVQPFLPEIVEEGEHSLVFFAGTYSHAVLKRPGPGDYRVQWRLGGGQARTTPSPSLLEQARAALAAAPETGLYARVDGVVRDGRFLLMELEQIEPHLFFEEVPGAAERLVEAIRARL